MPRHWNNVLPCYGSKFHISMEIWMSSYRVNLSPGSSCMLPCSRDRTYCTGCEKKCNGVAARNGEAGSSRDDAIPDLALNKVRPQRKTFFCPFSTTVSFLRPWSRYHAGQVAYSSARRIPSKDWLYCWFERCRRWSRSGCPGNSCCLPKRSCLSSIEQTNAVHDGCVRYRKYLTLYAVWIHLLTKD